MRHIIFSIFILVLNTGLLNAQEDLDPSKPNIVLFVTDDQRFDDLDGVMPLTIDRLFSKGARFSKAYVTTPACCPSRASILTGEYASSHAVRGNRFQLLKTTFVEHLFNKGYRTGLVGKYLNSWDGSKRPEYDFWVSFRGGSADFINPVLNVQGTFAVQRGYVTDIFHSYAVDFLESSIGGDKPFFLMLNYNAPHWPAFPHPDDIGKVQIKDIPRNPNFNEKDRKDKPRHVSRKHTLNRKQVDEVIRFRQRQRESLYSVDRSVAGLIDLLSSRGVLDNTAIIFISDNGVLAGDHALTEKDVAYEAATKVPCGIRFDKRIEPQVNSKLVANIDIAPTILDIAGLPIPASVNGRSWMELFSDPGNWRQDLLLEDFASRGSKKPFAAVVTEQYMFVRNRLTQGGADRNRLELYNLHEDPFQLRNLANVKATYGVRQKLRERLDELLLTHRGSLSFKKPKGLVGQKY
ncbi:MAG: sulfatase-like hydrolase/transferase [Bdellovibrionales bacterium]|nr:sulfatase-like hydrolase/transferase [Bdellovibrionales bacterium]